MYTVVPYHGIPEGFGGHIYTPNTNDVLCGRGGRINAHDGNVIFRRIVNMYKNDYLSKTATKVHKARIAAYIVARVRSSNPGGRFLKLDDKTGFWTELGDEKARKKAGQALREDASKFRQSKPTQSKTNNIDKSEKSNTSSENKDVSTPSKKNTEPPNQDSLNDSVSTRKEDKDITKDILERSKTPLRTSLSPDNLYPSSKSSTSLSTENENGKVTAANMIPEHRLTDSYTFKTPVCQETPIFSKPHQDASLSMNTVSTDSRSKDYFRRDKIHPTILTSVATSFEQKTPSFGESFQKSRPISGKPNNPSDSSSLDFSKIEPSALSSDDKTIDSYTLDVVMGFDKSGKTETKNPTLSFHSLAKKASLSKVNVDEKIVSDYSSRKINTNYNTQDQKQQLEELSKELCKLNIRKDYAQILSGDRNGIRSEWRQQMLDVQAFRRKRNEDMSDTSSDTVSNSSAGEEVQTKKKKKHGKKKKSRKSSSLSISSIMSPLNFFRKKTKAPPAEKNESCSLSTNLSLRDLMSIGSDSLSALCDFSHETNWMNSFKTMMSISTGGDTNISELTSDLVSLERKNRQIKKIEETACC